MANVLPLPIQAQRDADAVELIRVWIAEKGLHCAMKVGMFAAKPGGNEVRAWGIVLADVARHLSNALTDADPPTSAARYLEQIKEAMLAELAHPTSPMSGKFTHGPT